MPLEPSHAPGLLWAARDPEVSRYLVHPIGPALADVEAHVAWVLGLQAEGSELAFAVVLNGTGVPVGLSRFLDIDRANASVQIGGTFVDRELWRTPVNTEMKFLMLRHAFEVEGAHRVWLQTDLRNERSQRAIARLGATREGVRREDRRLRSGYFRSSVVYSVVADEWPRVRQRLEDFLARPWGPRTPEQAPSD